MPAAGAKTPVTLGYVSRPNGLRGAVVVHCDPSMADMFVKGLAVELALRGGNRKTVRVCSAARVKDGIRIEFDGIADRDASEALVGATVVADRADLAGLADDEYLDTDLVGLTVVTHEGKELGRIVEVIATGANDVYVVASEGGGPEILVPATANAEIEIDLAAGRVLVAGDALEYGATAETR